MTGKEAMSAAESLRLLAWTAWQMEAFMKIKKEKSDAAAYQTGW